MDGYQQRQRSQSVYEPVHHEMPVQEEQQLQPQQQRERRMSVPAGQTMARTIAARFPAAGEGPEPPAVPQLPAQEEMAPRSKRERRLLRERQEEQRRLEAEQRLRQEEDARRHAEEQRRAQEAEEERQRRDQEAEEERQRRDQEAEEERQRKEQRNTLYMDDHARELLAALMKEEDETQAVARAQEFIRAAAETLFRSSETIAEGYGVTADYTEGVQHFIALIGTQIEDEDTAEALINKAYEHKERFAALAQERSINAFANNGIIPLLEEECQLDERLENRLFRAAVEMSESYDEVFNRQIEVWAGFESVVARNLNMIAPEEKGSVNVFGSGSPFRYLTKKDMQEKFQNRIKELMAQDKTLTREQAERRVYAEHRQELEQTAQERSMRNAIVDNVPVEDWKRDGGSSTSQTMPAAQAYKLVAESNGFLYAKTVGNGLCELRPTLPEEVVVDNETIPLRRVYTLFIKSLMHGVLDNGGELTANALGFISDVGGCLSTQALMKPEEFYTELKAVLFEQFKSVHNGDEVAAEQTLRQMHKLVTNEVGGRFPPAEIMSNFEGVVSRIRNAGPGATIITQFDNLRRDLEKRGLPAGEIDGIMSQQVNPALQMRVYRMREEFLKNNGKTQLTPEQEKEIQAIYSLYGDLDEALREMMAIRNMDPSSPDVPLPNACSAHAAFIAGIRESFLHNSEPRLAYSVSSHLEEHPLIHLDYCLAHPEIVTDVSEEKREQKLARIRAIADRLHAAQSNGEPVKLTNDEKNLLYLVTVSGDKAPSKYIYHEAANLGKTKDGIRITSEGFAAETKQYLVTPFSRHHAVGLYRGEETVLGSITNRGMVKYYNHDNPLPDEDTKILINTNIKMQSNSLPGGEL